MKVFFLIIAFIAISGSQLKSQVIDNDIIYKKWLKADQKFKKKINLDSVGKYFDKKINPIIDSLKKFEIDTMLVYTVSHPGSYSLDSCDNDFSPSSSYVFWKSNNYTYVKRISNKCKFKTLKIKHSILFVYFDIYKDYLRKEKVVPVITGVETDNENNIKSFKMLFIDHTSHYKIYCKTGLDRVFFYFDDYQFAEKKNLFYEHNRNLKIYSWKTYIENELMNFKFKLKD